MQNYLFERAVQIKPARKKKRKFIIFLCILFVATALCTAGILLLRELFAPDADPSASGGGDWSNMPGNENLNVGKQETLIPLAPAGSEVRLGVTEIKGEKLTPTEVYQRALPSVVSVQAYFDQYVSTGSGIVISEDGYILTNYHIIEGAEEAEVSLLSDGRVFEAKLVGGAADLDLAVLKVEAKDLVPAEFYDSDALIVGEPVYALGNPLGYLYGSFTEGIVSAPVRSIAQSGISTSLIQTSAPLNQGNSGGALINEAGQVVGITTAKMSDNKGDVSIEGVGLAIPITNARGPVNSILANGRVITPRIGITCYEVVMDDVHGLLVDSATEGEPAEQAGILPQDIIIAANGESFVGVEGMKTIFYDIGVGNEVVLTVLRGMEELQISVLLIE